MIVGVNTDGVDVAQVRSRLAAYISATSPVTDGFFSEPACGRPEALAQTETILRIFSRLYPEWREENQADTYFEFRAQRDAATKLVARLDSAAEVDAMLGGDASPSITAASLHPLIWKSAQAQWSTGHHHEAVHAAAKAVNSMLQLKVNRRDVSETDLVRQSFSDRAPEAGKPRLRFDKITDVQTAESVRQGVMAFGTGCFQAIRNPIGHLPNDQVELDEQTALERLAALSLLARWVDEASVESV